MCSVANRRCEGEVWVAAEAAEAVAAKAGADWAAAATPVRAVVEVS